MKTNKFLLMAGVLCASLFSACSSDDSFEAGPQAVGQQAFFPQGTETKYEVSMDATSFDIPVQRVGTEAVTLPLKVTSNSTIFTVPTSLSFAQGKTESKLTVSYNPDDVVVGQYDTITVTVPEEYSTPYGLNTLTFVAGVDEPWVSLGMGKFSDWYSMEKCPYDVEYQQSGLFPNHFRIVKPYSEAYEAEEWEGDTPDDYLYFRILEPGEELHGITITRDDLVVFDDCVTGYYNSTYDATIILCHPSEFSSTATCEDDIANNYVASYQENGLPASVSIGPWMYMDGIGGYNYSTYEYVVELTFPGVADYSCEVEYAGRRIDVEENTFVLANCTLAADVASAKLALIQGKNSSAINAAVEGIANGSIEAVEVTADKEEYEVPMPADAESDSYTLVLVTFDAAGEVQDYNTATFVYTAAGAPTEEWTPAYVGTFRYTLLFGSEEEPYDDEGLQLSVSSLNPNRYKIEHVFYDVDFIFEMAEDGTISFDDQFTGYTHSSYGEVYVTDMYLSNPDEFDPSYYEDGVFNFSIGYFVEDGFLSYGTETFTLTGEAGAKAEMRMKSMFQKALLVREDIRPSRFAPVWFKPVSKK